MNVIELVWIILYVTDSKYRKTYSAVGKVLIVQNKLVQYQGAIINMFSNSNMWIYNATVEPQDPDSKCQNLLG